MQQTTLKTRWILHRLGPVSVNTMVWIYLVFPKVCRSYILHQQILDDLYIFNITLYFIIFYNILYNSVCVFCFLLIFFDFIAGFVDRLGLLRRQLRRAGRRSLSYDIKLNEAHDLSSKSGFYILLGMGLMFLAFLVLVVQKCLEFQNVSE